MNGKFGEFIAEKRKSHGLTLRGLAPELSIPPAYKSDIEKGNRSPPETNIMFDLAAGEKENTVSPDLPEYIMKNEHVRVALRMARDNNASSEVWQKVIEMMEEQERGKK